MHIRAILLRIMTIISVGFLLTAILWSVIRTLQVVTVINDAGLFAELSRILVSPDSTLYIDLWDNKPPGLFFFTAPFVLIFGNTSLAIQLAGVSLALLFAGGVAVLSYHLHRNRLAMFVAFVLGMFYAMIIIYSRGIETTLLMATLGTYGIYAVIASNARTSWLLIGGMLFSFAVFSKQPMALEFPLWLFAAWVFSSPKRRFRSILTVIVGCGLAVGMVLAWAYFSGNLLAMGEYLIWGNVRYAVGTENQYTPYWDYILRETLPIMTPLALLGLLSVIVLWRTDNRRALWLFFGLWFVLALAGAGLGKALKITYFVQVMPPLIVLVSLGFFALRQYSPRLLQVLLVLVPPVLLLSPQLYLYGYRNVLDANYAPQSPELRIAAFLQEHTQEGDCVWLWGYVNSISYYSEIPSCTAVPYEAMVMNAEGFNILRYRPQYISDLIQKPPAYLVSASAWGYFPMLEQYLRRYGREQITDLPYSVYRMDTASWHDSNINFADVFTMIGYDIYRKQDEICSGDRVSYSMSWRVQQSPTQYYQVFLQLRDAETHTTIASVDSSPLADYPTQAWTQVGEIVLSDTFIMTIPEDTPAGTYYVATGFYDTNTSERLNILDESDTVLGSETTIDTFSITSCAE